MPQSRRASSIWSGPRAPEEIQTLLAEKSCDGRGVFTQSYGSSELDASVLMIPLVGFLPASDPRVIATVEAIERELLENGFVRRYRPRRVRKIHSSARG